jgi:hypothetical protein
MRASASVSEGERRRAIIKELRVPHEPYPSWPVVSINNLRVGVAWSAVSSGGAGVATDLDR